MEGRAYEDLYWLGCTVFCLKRFKSVLSHFPEKRQKSLLVVKLKFFCELTRNLTINCPMFRMRDFILCSTFFEIKILDL